MPFLTGLRLLKRIPILRMLRLNLSKSGLGVSIGRRGAWFGRDSSGRYYFWIGLPGTGIGYRRYIDLSAITDWLLRGGAGPADDRNLRHYRNWYRSYRASRQLRQRRGTRHDRHREQPGDSDQADRTP